MMSTPWPETLADSSPIQVSPHPSLRPLTAQGSSGRKFRGNVAVVTMVPATGAHSAQLIELHDLEFKTRSSEHCGKSHRLGVRKPTSGSSKVTVKQSDSDKFPVLAGTQMPHLSNAYLCECGEGWVR